MNPRYDLHASESKPICSNHPDPIYITHDVLLTFVSSENLKINATGNSQVNVDKKFRFKIEPIGHGCGGILMSFSGYFQSPNYSNSTYHDEIFSELAVGDALLICL